MYLYHKRTHQIVKIVQELPDGGVVADTRLAYEIISADDLSDYESVYKKFKPSDKIGETAIQNDIISDISDIVAWFKQAKPNPNLRDISTQIGCHYEEVSEMAMCLGDKNLAAKLDAISYAYKQNACGYGGDKVELLDALLDQVVTAIGVGYMLGFDMVGGLAEVNRSNYSKFENGKPVFNENGKIAKGVNYIKPNLEPFLGWTS